MVLARNHNENQSGEELDEELLRFSDINNQLKALANKFGRFAAKYEELKSNLNVTNNSSPSTCYTF